MEQNFFRLTLDDVLAGLQDYRPQPLEPHHITVNRLAEHWSINREQARSAISKMLEDGKLQELGNRYNDAMNYEKAYVTTAETTPEA